ncbi:MAG: hypothetical protein QOF76_2817 [Solirubrobacteraceae bacterium]|nr:hypothetical protein [Solirubrobacteraceae bacterium]
MSIEGGDLRLEVVSGPAAGQAFAVEQSLAIGRLADAPGHFNDDEELSRQHAEIARRPDGTYWIQDLGSTNGTSVNGARISAPTPLKTGDTIEAGLSGVRVAFAPATDLENFARAATLPAIAVELPPEEPTSVRGAGQTAPAPVVAPPVPAVPPLTVRTVVDAATGKAEVYYDDTSPPLMLIAVDGRWQRA